MVYFFKDNFGKDVSKQALLTKLPVSLPFFFCLLFFIFVFSLLVLNGKSMLESKYFNNGCNDSNFFRIVKSDCFIQTY